MTPMIVRMKRTGETIPVPCGKCPKCLGRRTSGWSFRLMQEDKRSSTSMFVTLTYDTDHVPITQNGFMSLQKDHLQKFFKRLRKAHGEGHTTIKYYAVGEYGGKTSRPHYHIILFNANQDLICKAWGMGDIHYGHVNGATVGYTLKYVMKPRNIPAHRNDDRLREFAVMSKGLGSNYFLNEDETVKDIVPWHHQDVQNRMYCTLDDGRKIAMPRYYKNKIYQDSQKKAIAFACHVRNEELMQKHIREIGDAYWANKAESDMVAFKKMYQSSTKNRNKV